MYLGTCGNCIVRRLWSLKISSNGKGGRNTSSYLIGGACLKIRWWCARQPYLRSAADARSMYFVREELYDHAPEPMHRARTRVIARFILPKESKIGHGTNPFRPLQMMRLRQCRSCASPPLQISAAILNLVVGKWENTGGSITTCNQAHLLRNSLTGECLWGSGAGTSSRMTTPRPSNSNTCASISVRGDSTPDFISFHRRNHLLLVIRLDLVNIASWDLAIRETSTLNNYPT